MITLVCGPAPLDVVPLVGQEVIACGQRTTVLDVDYGFSPAGRPVVTITFDTFNRPTTNVWSLP